MPTTSNVPPMWARYQLCEAALPNIHIFPLQSRGKKPIMSGGFKIATDDKAQILNWAEQHPNANIGMPTGNPTQLVVIDVDEGEGKSGMASLDQLEEEIGLSLRDTFTVSTGGGGLHLYFKQPAELHIPCSQGRLAPCIDVRGDGGYVVAPGSVHQNGKSYDIVNDNQPASLPDALIQKLQKNKSQKAWKRSSVERQPKTEISMKDRSSEEDHPIVEDILLDCAFIRHCKAESASLPEDAWKAMMTIVGRCANGEDKVHKFSADYGGYSPHETGYYLDRAMHRTGPATCKFISSGLSTSDLCKGCIFRNQISSPIELGYPRHELLKSFIYIKQSAQFVNLNNGARYSNPDFVQAYKHKKDRKGNLIAPTILQKNVFLKPEKEVFAPGKDQLFNIVNELVFNSWHDCGVVAVEGDATPFIEHLEYLFPNEADRSLLLDFLAYSVQHPDEKVNYAMLVIGEEGTGKSFIGQALRMILGKPFVSCIDTEEMLGRFNSWLAGKTFVIVEEMNASQDDAANRLKLVITQETVRVEEKYQKPREINNCANLIAFSNFERPIHLEKGDRRFCVLSSPAKAKDPDYYQSLFTWLDENASVVRWWLEQRDLTNFNPKARAPYTSAKEALINGTTNYTDPIPRLISEKTDPFKSDVFSLSAVTKALEGELPEHVLSHPNRLAERLRDAGCIPLGPVRSRHRSSDERQQVQELEKGRQRLWAARNPEHWLQATDHDRWAELERGFQ